MKKTRILYVCIFVVILIVGAALSACAQSKVNYQIEAEDISSIEVYDITTYDFKLIYNLTANKNQSEIEEFVKVFESSVKFRDDVGTTHPKWAKVILNDGTQIDLWYGTQGFITVSDGENQFNIKNRKLENLLDSFLASSKINTEDFDYDDADSIRIVFDTKENSYKVLSLKKEEQDEEIQKILQLLKVDTDAEAKYYIEELDKNDSMMIMVGGWMYTFSFDEEYITFTGEPLSSYFDVNKKMVSVKNTELTKYIYSLIESGKYDIEVRPVDRVLVTSTDGQYEFDLEGTWFFSEIESSGSDDPNSSALNYGLYSSCWGNAITFKGDGTASMIYAFQSEQPSIETITWEYVYEDNKAVGVKYVGNNFGFILKLLDIKDGKPIFTMEDATGGDAQFGTDFVRTATLEEVDFFTSVE